MIFRVIANKPITGLWLSVTTIKDWSSDGYGHYTPNDELRKSSTQGSVGISYEDRNSSITPGYRNLMAKRLPLPMQPWSYKKEVTSPWSGFRRTMQWALPVGAYSRTQEDIEQGTLSFASDLLVQGVAGTFTNAEIDRVAQRAVVAVLSKMKNQKVDLGVALGESHQVISMIASHATKIASSVGKLKKGDLVGAARDLGTFAGKRQRARLKRGLSTKQSSEQAIASAWLELQYGWKPLLSDIYGAMESLATQDPGIRYHVVTAGNSQKKVVSTVTTFAPGEDRVDEGTSTYTVKYTLRYSVFSPGWAAARSYGLTNPLTIAWELTPFSFIVDWFIPIGKTLSALDASLGLTFADGCKTTFLRREGFGEYKYSSDITNPNRTLRTKRDGGFKKFHKYIQADRVKLSGFPTVSFPSFKNPFSVEHSLNALALLAGVFGRRL